MKKRYAGTGLILAGLLALTLSAQGTMTVENPTVVVGTFDSRAIAVAWVRSDAFSENLRALRGDVERAIERAEAIGDPELVADLEALGPEMQKRAHHQGFGAAPIDDIMARIEDELPRIAEEAGVDVIVSKWKLAYRSPAAELVDVTERLAAEFDPDAETLKVIREVVKTEPVPLDQLQENH